MRNIITLIDEYVEGMFSGDIVSFLHDSESRKLLQGIDKENVDRLAGELGELNNKLVPKYLLAKEPEKSELALKMFQRILLLRGTGVLRNNPNSIKEINFYRGKAQYYEDMVKDLTETVMKLKAGSSGIR